MQKGVLRSRRYLNRRLGTFFKEMELSEDRGTGIPTILRAMKNNGSPAPIFDTDDNRSYFFVELPVHPDFAGEKILVKEQGDVGDNDRDNYKRHIAPLISQGRLRMTLPDKPNSKNQRYIAVR